jgi:hypothetical protein
MLSNGTRESFQIHLPKTSERILSTSFRPPAPPSSQRTSDSSALCLKKRSLGLSSNEDSKNSVPLYHRKATETSEFQVPNRLTHGISRTREHDIGISLLAGIYHTK